MQSQTTEYLTSAVFDNGRRGNPRPGCDCVQCFGYCTFDKDLAFRDAALMHMKTGPSDITLHHSHMNRSARDD